ncbi:TAXI family TRAP transporter solute-binding subunit, partial [Kibdelosporangium lantanae]
HTPRALARIYDDYLHIVVRDESTIRSVKDLQGKRVAVGAKNSGVQVIAKRVLSIARVDVTQVNDSLGGSADQLKAGTIDAFFWSGGLPTREITALATKDFHIRLVDMSDVMNSIRAEYRYYSSATVPLSTYSLGGPQTPVTTPVTTLVVPNLLLVRDDFPAGNACAITKLIFDRKDELARTHPAAKEITRETAVKTDPVPLHPGARQALGVN